MATDDRVEGRPARVRGDEGLDGRAALHDGPGHELLGALGVRAIPLEEEPRRLWMLPDPGTELTGGLGVDLAPQVEPGWLGKGEAWDEDCHGEQDVLHGGEMFPRCATPSRCKSP